MPAQAAAAAAAADPQSVEDQFEWEVREESLPFWQHAVAGSTAGIAEHVLMYPLDTIKTRIQASVTPIGVKEAWRQTLQERGARGLFRGSLVIGAGCVPAHVGLFGTYEGMRSVLLDPGGERHQPILAGACAMMGTVVHDSVLTPMDVVKQRLQMGGYNGAMDCANRMYAHEGLTGFYRSLPVTLAMNMPYTFLLAATNDFLKWVIQIEHAPDEDWMSTAASHFLTAGISGGIAAGFTVWMDVVKTKLQTQGGYAAVAGGCGGCSGGGGLETPRYTSIASTFRAIYAEQGVRGFFNGMVPRVALAVPSAAICWGTYDCTNKLLARASTMDPVEREQRSRRRKAASLAESAAEAPASAPQGRGAAAADGQAAGYDWEEWDGSIPFWHHAVAGSCAGVMEHVAMYPVDTVKTRMQAAPAVASSGGAAGSGAVATARLVVQESGYSGLFRGCFAIGAGCIPAHIGLFCTYEFAKRRLMHNERGDQPHHQPVRAAMCGAAATVVHDMIITPTDVVKQRLQLGRHTGTMDCVMSIARQEGLRGFYRSLPTTLLTECPFHAVLVATNESLKLALGLEDSAAACGECTPWRAGGHFLSTGISGMVASVVTQPLDVVKTRLQTQSFAAPSASGSSTGELLVRYKGLLPTAKLIYSEEGAAGLFRGTVPRLVFAAPSAALCWGTYEVMKNMLRDRFGGNSRPRAS